MRRKKLINVVNKMFGIDKEFFKQAIQEKNIMVDVRAEDLSPEEIYIIFEIARNSPSLNQ